MGMLKLPLLAVLFFPAGFAQSPACEGQPATVRYLVIKPAGSIAEFMRAVSAQLAWYRSKGITDNDIYAAPVLVTDEKTGQQRYSDKEVMTFHINPPGPDREPKRDEPLEAAARLARDNADVKTVYRVCIPPKKQ